MKVGMSYVFNRHRTTVCMSKIDFIKKDKKYYKKVKKGLDKQQ